jgi:hypothetical protein
MIASLRGAVFIPPPSTMSNLGFLQFHACLALLKTPIMMLIANGQPLTAQMNLSLTEGLFLFTRKNVRIFTVRRMHSSPPLVRRKLYTATGDGELRIVLHSNAQDNRYSFHLFTQHSQLHQELRRGRPQVEILPCSQVGERKYHGQCGCYRDPVGRRR